MPRHVDSAAPAAQRPARPRDASMGLLNQVMARPLDPGYQAAARRRAHEGARARSPWRTGQVLVFALALGILLATAAATLRAPQPAVVQARAVLEQEIVDRAAEVEAAQEEIRALTAEIGELQRAALTGTEAELLSVLALDEVVTGAQAVTGAGIRVTLTDAADARPEDRDAYVHDVDLRIVVNGLWSAGAEGIAVNGQRLTALSAIRSAGGAVLVDLVPLAGPYRVEAIGDPQRLGVRFARTPAGDHLALLRTAYGIGVDVQNVEPIELGAAPLGALTRASAWPPAGAGTVRDDSDDGGSDGQGAPGPAGDLGEAER